MSLSTPNACWIFLVALVRITDAIYESEQLRTIIGFLIDFTGVLLF